MHLLLHDNFYTDPFFKYQRNPYIINIPDWFVTEKYYNCEGFTKLLKIFM